MMTDKEILTTANNCINGCLGYNCPYDEYDADIEKCMTTLMDDMYNLLLKQQAEIEALKKTNPLFEYAAKSVHQYIEDGKVYYLEFVCEEYEAEAISKKIDYLCHIQDIRTEAIKEFVSAIEKRLEHNWDASWEVFHSVMGSIHELAASRGVE